MTVSDSARATASPFGPVASPGPSPARGSRLGRSLLILLAALAMSWLVPIVAYAAHAAVVLPVLFIGLVASLLRSGRTVLDRLVFAFSLAVGATCLAGLVFSVWPWGLHPVPVAGVGFTAVSIGAVVAGRRPALPRTVNLPDLVTVALTAAVTIGTVFPYLGRGLVGRLSLVVVAEDLGRHFALYDTIRTAGGYTFLNRSETRTGLTNELFGYPQGSHFGMSLFDNFLRSSTAAGSATTALDHFVYFYAATLVFLVFAVLWSMRWIAGTALSTWRYVAVGTAAMAYLYFGDGMAMFLRGFPSEFVGLGLLALLVAVTSRPLPRLREQMCVLAALTVGLSFTYYLFLPLAGVLLLVWMFGNRKRLFGQPLWTVGAVVVTAFGALYLPILNSESVKSDSLNAGGGISPTIRHLLALLVLVVALGLLSRSAWRNPVRRMAILWMVCAGGVVALMFVYQSAIIGETSYYYEKLLHQLIVVALVCLGATWFVAPRWRPGHFAGRARRSAPFTRPVPALVLAMALFAALALNANPDRDVWRKPPRDLSWGVGYFTKKMDHPRLAQLVLKTIRAQPDPRGHATIVQMKNDWQANYYGTLWVDVLSRNLGTAWQAKPYYGTQETPEQLTKRIVVKFPKLPIRVVTDDPEILATVQTLRRDRPDLGLEVLFSNPSRCTYDFKAQPAPKPGERVAPVPRIPFPANGCKSPQDAPDRK
ncbi:hypothetical protein [Embleya sp. NPDC020630]|uniref:hypothetical protein n=1 Tax=Embleya sp. NPDC020630 TaxID=3363979 RepID=UPI0037BB25A0